MRHLCIDCNYIFDEAYGENELGIEPGSRIEDIADIFACPNCGALSDMFEPIREEILHAEYPGRKIGPELEHIPFVHFSDGKEIEVMVGEQLHPHEEEHYITSLALYDEYGDRVEEVFFSPDEDPVASFDVSDLDSYELRAVCNIHGTWSTGIIENISL